MNDIENISDQLDGYMEDVYKIIEKFKQGRGLTRAEAIEIAKIAVKDIKVDILWKRLKDLNNNLEELINIMEGK